MGSTDSSYTWQEGTEGGPGCHRLYIAMGRAEGTNTAPLGTAKQNCLVLVHWAYAHRSGIEICNH